MAGNGTGRCRKEASAQRSLLASLGQAGRRSAGACHQSAALADARHHEGAKQQADQRARSEEHTL